MNTIEVLKNARETLAIDGVWTKYAYARLEDGTAVTSDTPGACRFCAIGAITVQHKGTETCLDAVKQLCITLQAEREWMGQVQAYNDQKHVKLEHILSLYDSTIERLSK